MSVAAWDITTFAKVKTYLKILSTDTVQDVFLQDVLTRISGMIETYCGRKIAVQSISSEISDGNGSRFIYPIHFPISQLSVASGTPSSADILGAVQKRNDVDSSWEDIETDVDHIFYDTVRPYIELFDEVFPVGRRNVRLIYKAGLAGAELGELEQTCIEIVSETFKESNQGDNKLGKQTQSDSGGLGNLNISFRNLKPEWKEVLDRYRLPRARVY